MSVRKEVCLKTSMLKHELHIVILTIQNTRKT